MKDEALVVSSFFFFVGKGGQDCSSGPLPKDCSPQKFSKKFFRVGVWGGFEWVGGIGNSGVRGVGGTGICGRCCFGGDMMYLHILHDVIM